ncbi:MAG: glycoside hydrolase family 2 TIM barrel-domain containing protein [Kiritimatiellia bacterium]
MKKQFRKNLSGSWFVEKGRFALEDERKCAQKTEKAWPQEQVSQPGKVFYADPLVDGHETPGWNRVTLAHIDPEDGAMLYRREQLPSHWAGMRIFLCFDAVYPAARFYLNGICLGEHLSGLTPVEFDVTGHVQPGSEALLAVRLLRRHPFVQLDMPRHAMEFSGLAQQAFLEARPLLRIEGHHLSAILTEDHAEGRLEGSVSLVNDTGAAVSPQLECCLCDASGLRVGQVRTSIELEPHSRASADMQLRVVNPALWSDEYPNLYSVELTLHGGDARPHELFWRTGFRRLTLSPEGAFLNGAPVKFRGVNHLTFHPDHGMYTPRDWLRANLALMKKANVNAIRTHFTGPPDLSDLCDEMGFYLLQEVPIDWGTDYIHDPAWMPPARERVEALVKRDRHHCSLMVWSVGNENMAKTPERAGAGRRHLRELDELVKSLDPTRPTMFPPPGPANAIDGILELRVGDIADTHYSFRHIKRFLREGAVENPDSWEANMRRTDREEALTRGWSGTWFSSEYGIYNAMPDLIYNPLGSVINDVPEDALSGKCTLQAFEERLRREWGFMRHEPGCLGGAYFPWLCGGAGAGSEGNPWGWVRWGEDADWGVVTADLMPKPIFWALRVLFSPVWLPDRMEWQGEDALCFTVWNQYNAIDLSDCTLRVQQNPGGLYAGMMRHFTDVPMTGRPGEKAEVTLPLEPAVLKGLRAGNWAVVRCTVLDPKGFRPVMADILVVPPQGNATQNDLMNIGPDAVMEGLE